MVENLFDRRREKRFTRNELPKVLHTFMLLVDGHKQIKVETIDASANGICLHVPLNCSSFTDSQITITSLDQSVRLTDDILYIQAMGTQASRLSIMFSRENLLKPYFRTV